jgi:hypothetical protein
MRTAAFVVLAAAPFGLVACSSDVSPIPGIRADLQSAINSLFPSGIPTD